MKDTAGRLFQNCKIFYQKQCRITSLRRCWRHTTTIQIFSKRSQLVANHECTTMTLKPKSSCTNESVQKSDGRKNTLRSVKCKVYAHFVGILLVHQEFFPQSFRVNKEYYPEVIGQLRETIRQKRTEFWKNNHGFCIMITHQLPHRCLGVRFCPKTES